MPTAIVLNGKEDWNRHWFRNWLVPLLRKKKKKNTEVLMICLQYYLSKYLDQLTGVNSIKTFSFNLFHWCQTSNPVAFFDSPLKYQNVQFCVYISKWSRLFFSLSLPLHLKLVYIFNLIHKLQLPCYFYLEI